MRKLAQKPVQHESAALARRWLRAISRIENCAKIA
jgi:hypothetical protein